MKLNTRIEQTNIGMIKSKPAWRLYFNLELTAEEAELVKVYALNDYPLFTYNDNDGEDKNMSLEDAIKGKGGQIFTYLGKLNVMKNTLIEECARFNNYLKQIREIRAGGGMETIEYAPLIPPAASAAPPQIRAQ